MLSFRDLVVLLHEGNVAAIGQLARNATGLARNQALIDVSISGRVDVAALLLGLGADPNTETLHGPTTPLSLSVKILDDATALAMVQLLAMAGANLAHPVAGSAETAAETAARRDKMRTAEWLELVADYSPVQICVSLGRDAELKALLARQECDPFARAAGTPSLAELAAGTGPLLRLCREVRSKWAPSRHHLFHPAHRSAVASLMLVSRRDANRRALGWQWLSGIPPEIWLLIAENLGRMGWPHEGRVEVWPF